MKRIAFFVQHMLCGGVENALISLTTKLAAKGNDITIYLIRNDGEFLNRINSDIRCTLIPMPEKIRNQIQVGGSKLTLFECREKHQYARMIQCAFNRLKDKTGFAELAAPLHAIPRLDEKYDIAVNYHMHSPFLVWYLSERVSAKKKISWIHNDFSTTNYQICKLKDYLECCSAFYGVSKQVVSEFTYIFPEWKKNTEVMYNIVPYKEIIKKGNDKCEEFSQLPTDTFKILSVGRLENQKGYDISLSVCELLKQNGYKFKWIILGEGSERVKLEKEIKEKQLEQYISLLGIRNNPYPYFRFCDLYVQTSRHEGYVTTVTEANIFNKPIVCTKVSGAEEQIVNGVNGFVTSFDIKEIFEKIVFFMTKHLQITEKDNYNTFIENEENCLSVFE